MKSITLIFALCLFYFNINSQTNQVLLEKPDLKYRKTSKFYKEKIIFVLGDNCPDYNLYSDQIDRLKAREKTAEVKTESELTASDYRKHLYFYGNINWYSNWKNYNIPVEITEKGFLFGNDNFTKKTNAIMLINSDRNRYAFVGNSMEAFDDRGSWGAYDYFILDNTKRIQWGNLLKNTFDSTRNINSLKARPLLLKSKIDLDYLNIYYPDDLTDNENYFVKLNEIKLNLDKIIDLLELKNPTYVIEGYIYKNKEHKIQLCYHEGSGVAYPNWKEIDVIFNEEGNNNVIIHESIHILFDNEIKNSNNSPLLAEGIVGYSLFKLNSNGTNEAIENAKLYLEEPIEKWFDERIYSGREIPWYMLYPMSEAWVTFLIQEYGLSNFKKLYKIPASELQFGGYEKIYGKSITELTTEFKDFVKKD